MKTLLFALCFLAGGLLSPCIAADATEQQEKDLFDALFQGRQEERKPQWSAEHRALFSSASAAIKQAASDTPNASSS